jgi:HAMP domain-containing protein
MLALLRKDANMTVQKQHQVMSISVALPVLAAILGLLFAGLVSAGVTRAVRRLLEGAKAVEAGDLDGTLVATSKDEIGHLTIAFNQMVEQLRLKERLRETFGKYVDPRVVEGLIEGPALAAEGQRRVMTVLFCDVRRFTSTS